MIVKNHIQVFDHVWFYFKHLEMEEEREYEKKKIEFRRIESVRVRPKKTKRTT
jgi:hypothetical protein